MTASPLEARCSVCLDTGSKSQDIEDFLNCTSCDAAERRMEMQNYVSGLSPLMSNWAKCWAAYNLGMRRPAAPVAAQQAMPKLPSTPEEVVAFIGDHFDVMDTVGDIEDRLITLSVHDLLSCFQNLADFAGEVVQPADPEDMAANYDHSTHDKRMEVLKDLRAAQPLGVPECGACHGTGWIPRDADIGTEQECFSCDGSGESEDAAPQPAAQPSDDVVLKAAVERMQKAHAAAKVPAKLPAYDEAFEYQAAVHALIKAAVAKEKA